MKKQWSILVILVLVMAALCLGVWAGSLRLTEVNNLRLRDAAMGAVLPGAGAFTAESFEDPEGILRGAWRSDKGYAVETSVPGYHGDVTLMVGVSESGMVIGLKVLALQETPGLGRQARADQEFLSQFLGTVGDAALGEPVDSISGATVTSKAFIRAINAAAGYVTGADVSSGATEWGG